MGPKLRRKRMDRPLKIDHLEEQIRRGQRSIVVLVTSIRLFSTLIADETETPTIRLYSSLLTIR